MGKEQITTRCQGTFTPFPQDFGNEWQHLVEFVNWGFLQETRLIDLRHLPAEAHSDFLWAVLCTLEKLQRVLVMHGSQVPCLKSRQFAVEVSLQASAR